jgi:hypothetical protein
VNKAEALAIIEKCIPIYQKLINIPGYELTEDEKACLASVDHAAIRQMTSLRIKKDPTISEVFQNSENYQTTD